MPDDTLIRKLRELEEELLQKAEKAQDMRSTLALTWCAAKIASLLSEGSPDHSKEHHPSCQFDGAVNGCSCGQKEPTNK